MVTSFKKLRQDNINVGIFEDWKFDIAGLGAFFT
jgi:hypothetical protein